MAESNPNPDQNQRRSTRIVQAVPLTVTGVDALGRPFQERTSTLIINCHGARYQSKHYVLKNMWVTLDVPHNEAGQPSRTVRGRVTWIQRPRTVRELFQIGIELEVPGNVWGIAFPPGDWFPFPEAGMAPTMNIPAPTEPRVTIPPPRETASAPREVPPAPREWPTEKISTPPPQQVVKSFDIPAEPPAIERVETRAEDNVRVLPTPATGDTALQLARQFARLVAEAKQQIQNTARESASNAVAAETRPLLAVLQSQLSDATEKSVSAAVAAHMERSRQETLQRLEKEKEAGMAAMLERLSEEMDVRLNEAREQIDTKLAEVERTGRAKFEEQIRDQLQAAIQKLETLSNSVGSNREEVRSVIEQLRESSAKAAADEIHRWQEQMDQRTADAQARLAQMDQTARRLGEQIAAATTLGEVGWRGLLESDLEAAHSRWKEKLDASIQNASLQASEQLTRDSQMAARQIEQELQQRIGSLVESLGATHTQITTSAEAVLGNLRAAIQQETARGEHVAASLRESVGSTHAQITTSAEAALGNLRAAIQQETARGEHVIAGLQESLGSTHTQITTSAEAALGNLRAAIQQETARGEQVIASLQESIGKLEAQRAEFAARLQAHSGEFTARLQTNSEELAARLQANSEELARRSDALLASQTDEMNRRAEATVTGMAQRLQPLLESAGHDTIEKLAGELEQRLAPQIARTSEILGQISLNREQAEKALAEHQQRIWQVSDRALQDTAGRGKELLADIEKDFTESARSASARWLTEIETRATETSHSTFESLFKSAEWYEKKIQSHMQTTLEKGIEQATARLREKAAEMSGLFASELDHYSRSYVEHAQGQMHENAGEAAETGIRRIMEASDAAAAKFTERAAQLGSEQFDAYAARTKGAFEQHASHMEAHTAQVRSSLESDARGFAVEFQRALAQHAQQTLALGKQELGIQIDQAKDALLIEKQTLERQFQASLGSLGTSAIEEHKQRLENASNSWLLTTVSKLNQQSVGVIDELAQTTEKRLRAVCGAVFAEMGETLRQRLAGVTAAFIVPEVPVTPSAAPAKPADEHK